MSRAMHPTTIASSTEQASSRGHQRTPSGPSKKRQSTGAGSNGKPSRSAATRRDTSKTQNKSGSARTSLEIEDDDDDMDATFLQYCTTCEKQIVVPSSSVLYCSEACKAKDAAKATLRRDSYAPDLSPSHSRHQSPVGDDSSDHDVVPQRSPTVPSAPFSHRSSVTEVTHTGSHSYSSYTSQTDGHMSRDHSSSSLSSLSRSGTPRSRPGTGRTDSEAAHYLGQFHSSGRPRYSRCSTSNTLPSLTHTPASHAAASAPYTPSATGARLPPRTHTSFSSKSIDLVTPISAQEQAELDASIASDDTVRAGFDKPSEQYSAAEFDDLAGMSVQQLSYEKQEMRPKFGSGGSSLKQLFEFEQMRR